MWQMLYITDTPMSRVSCHSTILCHLSSNSSHRYIENHIQYDYRPKTMLREGNVFTGVCLSVNLSMGEGVRSHGRVTPAIPYPSPDTLSSGYPTPSIDIWWSSLETCSSNLFTWGPTPPPRYWHIVVDTEAGGTHLTGMLSCYYCVKST